MEDINSRLEEPCDEREEYLATSLANHGLEYVRRKSTPRRRYIGQGRWTRKMQREGRQVMGRGEYLIGMSRGYFMNLGLREPRLHIDHRMMLAEIRREGVTRNKRYRWGRIRWPIRRSIHRPQPEREATFDDINDELDRDLRPTAVRED